MGLYKISEFLKIGHLVSDGGGAEIKVSVLGDGTASYRLPRL
jgi:hypothetical protein